MTTAPDVLALQETDQALDRARARLTDVEAQMGESDGLITARQAVAERQELVTQLRSRLHDAEWSVDDAREKASEVEGKLYGGTIRNPKELADLDADLSSLKTQVAKREDTLLGLLVEIEEAEALLGAAQSALTQTETIWQRDQEAFLKEKSRLEPEIAALESRRRGCWPALSMATEPFPIESLKRPTHRRPASSIPLLNAVFTSRWRDPWPARTMAARNSGVPW